MAVTRLYLNEAKHLIALRIKAKKLGGGGGGGGRLRPPEAPT